MLLPKEVDQLNNYIKKLTYQPMIDEVTELLDTHNDLELFKICVPSYNFNPKKSRFLVLAKQEPQFFNHIEVYCYDNQKELYKDFPNKVYCDPDFRNRKYPITHKRQFILDVNRSIDHFFEVDDDVFVFNLPIPTLKSYGNINLPEKVSFNIAFNFWTHLVQKYNIDLSGLYFHNAFKFRPLEDLGLMRENQLFSQCLCISPKNDINYDVNAGWEDYDFYIQYMLKHHNVKAIFMNFESPPMGLELSTIRYDENSDRVTMRSLEFIAKYGTKISKIYNQKFDFNIKINTLAIRKAKDINDLVDPIEITPDIVEKIKAIFPLDISKQEKTKRYYAILNKAKHLNTDW